MIAALLLGLALFGGQSPAGPGDRGTAAQPAGPSMQELLDDVFVRFGKSPDYRFDADGVYPWRLAKWYFPERYAKLVQFVADARWRFPGSWLAAAEPNVASPESLIRQCLYGNELLNTEFKRSSQDVYLPDGVGFPSSLPTIAHQCGLTELLARDLGPDSADGSPFPACRWQGVDGSTLATTLATGQGLHGEPDSLTSDQISKLPSYDGELLATSGEAGLYTAAARMKRWNRRNEFVANAAESTAVIADWLGGPAYPLADLTDAWSRFLRHQTPADLGGASPAVAATDEQLALNRFGAIMRRSISTIAAVTDTTGDGLPLVVYNPVSEGRVEAVEVRLPLPDKWTNIKLLDANGDEAPCQIDSRANGVADIVFVARAPAFGVAVYHVVPSKSAMAADPSLVASTAELDSRDYHIKLNEAGDIVSIQDKSTFHEQLTGPIRFELLDDPGDTISYATVTAKPRALVDGPSKVHVIETGPARVGVEIDRTASGSTFVQRLYLSPGSGRIDCMTHVDWHTPKTLLKLDFPLAATASDATYDLGFGTVERGVDTPKQYEVPAQAWADQTTPGASFGTSILTDGKTGWDKPDDGHLRLSLIHSAGSEEFGEHTFTYSIFGHGGDWRNGTWRAAACLNQPLRVVATDSHKGGVPSGLSFLATSNAQFQVVAFKKAETGDRLIVRVVEKNGQPLKGAVLSFADPIKKAVEVDGQERDLPGKPTWTANNGDLTFDLGRFQPRTFAVTLQMERLVHAPTSTPLALSYDATLAGAPRKPLPSGAGHAAAGALPATMDIDGIRFQLGTADADALVCRGQALELPKDTTRVELLAASTDGNIHAAFGVGEPVEMEVPSFTDPFDGPAEPETAPVAWIGPERLDALGRLEPYQNCYLFEVTLEVPSGVTLLTLPNTPTIKLVAATAVSKAEPRAVPVGGFGESGA